MDEGFKPAIEIYEKYRHFYESIDVKTSAARKDDCWYNVRTRILLNYNKKAETTKRLVDTGNFVIISKTIKAKKFNQLIEKLSGEEVEIDGLEIRFLEKALNIMDNDDDIPF